MFDDVPVSDARCHHIEEGVEHGEQLCAAGFGCSWCRHLFEWNRIVERIVGRELMRRRSEIFEIGLKVLRETPEGIEAAARAEARAYGYPPRRGAPVHIPSTIAWSPSESDEGGDTYGNERAEHRREKAEAAARQCIYKLESADRGNHWYVVSRGFRYNIVMHSPKGEIDLAQYHDEDISWLNKVSIVSGVCALCGRMVQWRMFCKFSKRAAVRGLIDALKVDAGFMSHMDLPDPGRIVCTDCAPKKPTETNRNYVERMHAVGVISLTMSTTVMLSGSHSRMKHYASEERGFDMLTSSDTTRVWTYLAANINFSLTGVHLDPDRPNRSPRPGENNAYFSGSPRRRDIMESD